MKRKLFILTFCTLLVIGLGFYWRVRAFAEQGFYDFCFDNEPVVNEKMLENIGALINAFYANCWNCNRH